MGDVAMNTMKKTTFLPIVAVFLLIIYAVPVTQGIVERCKGQNIQALDLVVDALFTPFNNAKKLRELALRQSAYGDSIASELAKAVAASWISDRALQLADEALVNAGDLKKAVYTKNRHVRTDSTAPSCRRIDMLSALLSGFLASLRDGSPVSALASRCAAINDMNRSLTREYSRPSLLNAPLLALYNFKYILWNDQYLRPYEREMENSSVFAAGFRSQMQKVFFFLFRDLGAKGVLGRNGWFFYKPDVDFLVKPYVLDRRSIVVDPNDKPVSDNPVAAIKNFKNQLDSLGIDLLFVIMPGKPGIYPDMVSAAMKPESAGTFSHSLRMIHDLRREGVETVDLFAPFVNERLHDREAGDSMYLREDTHWKARAVRLASRVVADRIRRYPWFKPGTAEYAVDSVFVERTGDIGVMTTLSAGFTRRLSGSFKPEKTKCYQVYRITRDERGAVSARTLYKDDFKSSEILILGDSFSRIYQTDEPRGAGWIAHLALELSQPVASLVNDGGASTLVRQTLARKPNLLKGKKLVVWEVVERDFRFGEEGWKDVPISLNIK
jgi:hypothetical protein